MQNKDSDVSFCVPEFQLDIDTAELEEARWFTREEITAAYERITGNPGLLMKNETNELIIPPSGAIAHHLLKNWIGL
jgi:NADH pyrophosphatase NudC (nudix superfamily)